LNKLPAVVGRARVARGIDDFAFDIQAAPFWLRADQVPGPSTKIVTVKVGETVEDIDLTSG
jgi:hypothetical protein